MGIYYYKGKIISHIGAYPRPTHDFCPTRNGRFCQPEAQGRYLGKLLLMAVSRGSSDLPYPFRG